MDYVIKTEKFHKIIVKRRYVRKFNIHEQTIRNLLAYYLSLACEKYNNEADFNKFLGKNYDLRYYVSINSIGCYSYLSFTLTCVDPKYINDNNYNIDLIINSFNECIKPVIKHKSFDKKIFKRAKEIYLSNLLYSTENEFKNAVEFAINTYFKDTLGIVSDGNIDELEKISPKMLYDYYLSILNDERVDYICGNTDMLPVNKSSLTYKDDFIINKRNNKEKYVSIDKQTNQCYLEIVYNVNAFTNTKDFYTASIINYEFGGKSNSKLFQIVREKYGLCYHISSTYYGSRGIILVSAVINRSDVKLVEEKIDEVFKSILTDINLDTAKHYFYNSILEEQDKMGYLINNSFMDNYFLKDFPSINEKSYYDSITITDVENLYKNITKDLVCVYGGSNE